MKSNIIRKWLPDVVAVALFAIISFAYFIPADLEGRILYHHDASAGRGAGQEQLEYRQRTGERTRWTNSTFSGMPTYQTAPSYDSTDALQAGVKAYHLWLPENVWYVFVYLLGFYILIRSFTAPEAGTTRSKGMPATAGNPPPHPAKADGQSPWRDMLLALLGAVAWAFSSYFFIIIAAGHIWKVWALAYLPPLIAGIVMAYKGRYLWGFILTAVFTAFEVNANHVQMTYYYLFVIVLMVIAYAVEAVRRRLLPRFAKATVICMAGAMVGIAVNISNLYHTWQYSKESMRSKSELVKQDTGNQTSSGLDRDYITQWSYGIGETWTLLIPNAKGGAHNIQLADNTKALGKADPDLRQFVGQWYQYWGEQPFTAGPVYVGAFVLMLAVLALFIVRGPMKWALLTATILSILLSWGKNFMPFTNLFIDYMPMYAKFRTVSSILVIAEFTIPLLGVMGLKELLDQPEKYRKPFWTAFALTGGACLLFALAPGCYSNQFVSTADKIQLSQYVSQEYLPSVLQSISEVRKAVFTADCWRSFIVIAIGTVIMLAVRYKKLQKPVAIMAIAVLCLGEMWMVNKRYLNDSMFVKKSVREQPQQPTIADREILKDSTLDYRVLNLTTNTFNENETSYYHKSIGGYHAAKLRRYQELIDACLLPEMSQLAKAINASQGDFSTIDGDSIFPVLNMLNTKYFIIPLQGGGLFPLTNPYAQGNAWFVDRVNYVENANEELDGLALSNLRHEAVADRKFAEVLGEAAGSDNDSTRQVTLTAYEPNELKYQIESTDGGIVVFSEIYYPGWKATIDGEKAEIGRVNYVLRALKVPAGKHEIVLTFKPDSVKTTETIAYVAYAILILSLVGGACFSLRNRRHREQQP
ncbi:MAG: YfhO family protein [Prevotella sp.]|nr:YfhO family protein [Prevotella sp.]